jgi:ParB/RepB/Spo0J family partition protein
MSEDEPEIRSIPVDLITVLNSRVRNKRVFQELVDSIAHLGLKKPITVSKRPGRTRYDLVCGQGRLEAFIALGQTEIPALVVDASEEDCYIMSLVENLARRQQNPLELVHAIGALAGRGYSHAEIAKKSISRSSMWRLFACSSSEARKSSSPLWNEGWSRIPSRWRLPAPRKAKCNRRSRKPTKRGRFQATRFWRSGRSSSNEITVGSNYTRAAGERHGRER